MEIKEYLEKLYSVKVDRIATSISLGKTRRVPGRGKAMYRLPDYKKVYLIAHDVPEGGAAAAAVTAPEAERR